MNTSATRAEPRGVAARIDDRFLHVTLGDGRELSVPLAWFPRLANASPDARAHWTWVGDGVGMHWPELDEDISIKGLLTGR